MPLNEQSTDLTKDNGDQTRRAALIKLGKSAAYAAPVTLGLMTLSTAAMASDLTTPGPATEE